MYVEDQESEFGVLLASDAAAMENLPAVDELASGQDTAAVRQSIRDYCKQPSGSFERTACTFKLLWNSSSSLVRRLFGDDPNRMLAAIASISTSDVPSVAYAKSRGGTLHAWAATATSNRVLVEVAGLFGFLDVLPLVGVFDPIGLVEWAKANFALGDPARSWPPAGFGWSGR